MTNEVGNENDVDALKKKLMELINAHAKERAELATKISNLLKENEDLNRQVHELDTKCKSRANTVNVKVKSPENEFGLDFSLPEDRK